MAIPPGWRTALTAHVSERISSKSIPLDAVYPPSFPASLHPWARCGARADRPRAYVSLQGLCKFISRNRHRVVRGIGRRAFEISSYILPSHWNGHLLGKRPASNIWGCFAKLYCRDREGVKAKGNILAARLPCDREDQLWDIWSAVELLHFKESRGGVQGD